MAKKSAIEKNKTRIKKVEKYAEKRKQLKKIIMNKETSSEDRFQAVIKLSSLPKNGCAVRIRNRCELSGRPRGFYRRVKLSRIALRDLAASGQIPGMIKASW
ncbi:30S ribosomal protein S14 [Alphaproteobacteria bacterium]|nr:30S ribosomal protein S14 [Alphaproteobacteria bacterium]